MIFLLLLIVVPILTRNRGQQKKSNRLIAKRRGLISGRLRKEVLRRTHPQGLGRFTDVERMDRIEPDLQAVTTRLRQSPFLFAQVPTGADCSIGPMICAGIASPVPTRLSARAREDAVLAAYAARMNALPD